MGLVLGVGFLVGLVLGVRMVVVAWEDVGFGWQCLFGPVGS